MTSRVNALTGAAGLLGSHIAEQLAARGERIRALVRPATDTAFLRSLGAELVEGDLADVASLRRAVQGADVVYHCAAQVGDWAPWHAFQSNVIDATRNLLDACSREKVGRLLHVSSIMVYGHPQQRADSLFTEDEPLGQGLWLWEHYAKSKIAAEELVRSYPGDWSIVRPSWFYGPRDRRSLLRLIKGLRAGRLRLLGKGDNLLNVIYVGDVADGAIRAATAPVASRQAFNLSSEGELTQKQLLDLVSDTLGWPRVTRSVGYRYAYFIGFISEVIGKMIFLKRPPHITRYAVRLVGRPALYSTAKARTQLGWTPNMPFVEGVKRSLEWFREQPGNAALLEPAAWMKRR